MEETNDTEVIQESEYSQKTDFSKGEIVRAQVARCCEIRSKELREGYFNFDKLGNKVYIPDTRREWVSAVKALRNILSPEIARSKDYQQKEALFFKEEKRIFDKWSIYPEVIDEGYVTEDTTEERYVPELDEISPVRIAVNRFYADPQVRFEAVTGKHNRCFHGYWRGLAALYDLWFAELNILIDQCNYFKKGRSF